VTPDSLRKNIPGYCKRDTSNILYTTKVLVTRPKILMDGLSNSVWLRTVDAKGVRGSVVVKALCYKPEGRGFETR
jgi:hypothetical protein